MATETACRSCDQLVVELTAEELASTSREAYRNSPLAHFNPGGNFVYAGDHEPDPVRPHAE